MRKRIENKQYDEERALYFAQNCDIKNCIFAGKADGESVLKEARDITVTNCSFSLRYPLWHVKDFTIKHTIMDKKARAGIWYAENGSINECTLKGIKVIRECYHIDIDNCKIISPEFGWKSSYITLKDTKIVSEYIFLDSRNVTLNHVKMKGKYSFQYMENVYIETSVLDTKDAFWHSKNVTVKDSIIKGEYLAWFSEGLILINCKISGTQPFCYCKNLKLINCTMDNTDLAFEYSDVEADINGYVESIKNPKSGTIFVDSVGDIIKENPIMKCNGQVVIRKSE